ncbi:MAG: diphthine--ammonia ligase [Halobacteria archaeon]|nr:diphthine--ammonia ligase [Halobacteria archaeon]
MSEKKACALFSGGKDSTLAVWRVRGEYDVETLLSVRADEGSYMYHVPAVELVSHAADAMGKKHEVVESDADPDDDEVAPLKDALAELDIDAVVTGAVESEYQKERIDRVCDRLGVESVAPLWHVNPVETLHEVTETFDVIVTGVAADGLDEGWLGRELNSNAVDELLSLSDERGIHPMGEGGEFETLVVGGPHMDGRIELEFEKRWDGVRGRVEITQARVVEE